jgi:glycosyltransferase involved in cell wall biosynthesis
MAAGLPVLVAESPESAASGFALSDDFRFPAGDAATLAEKIDALIEHPVKLEAARERYREIARPLSFDDGVETLLAVYRSVLRERPDSDRVADDRHSTTDAP